MLWKGEAMDSCNDLNVTQMQPGRGGKNNRREEITHSSAVHTYPTLSSEYPGMRRCLGHLLIMTLTTSIPPACNRLVISRDYFIRLCRQQGRTLLYLLSGHRELNTLAGLDLGLDEGPDGVNGESMKMARMKPKRGLKVGWANSAPMVLMLVSGMEARPSMLASLYLFPPQTLSHLQVELMTELWKQIRNQYNWSPGGNRDPGTNLEAVDELGKMNIAMVTERGQGLKVASISAIPELDPDEVPIVQSRTGVDSDGNSGSVTWNTLEFWWNCFTISDKRNSEMTGW